MIRLAPGLLALAAGALAGPAAEPAAVRMRAERRARVAALVGEGYAVVLGQPLTDVLQPRQHGHFLYLTGVEDPDAALVLAGAEAAPLRAGADPAREVLFVRDADPRFARFFGLRHLPGPAAARALGVAQVRGVPPGGEALGRVLAALLPAEARLHVPEYDGADDAPVREIRTALAVFLERARPDVTLVDLGPALSGLRAVKDAHELAQLERAAQITLAAFHDALPEIRPGSSEGAVDGALLYAVRRRGAWPAYTFVVGAGANAAVPHYFENRGPLRAGQLLVIDAGAAVERYAADVTRTFPVSGRFTPRQREIYTAVLRAQRAALGAVRAGATLEEVDAAARAVLKEAGLARYFIHATSHHVGLDVHDPGPACLEAGMTITVEPGVYLPEEALGVRIEDMVVVTEDGCRLLTDALPKDPDAVEALLAGRK